jgi:hypothetical protein
MLRRDPMYIIGHVVIIPDFKWFVFLVHRELGIGCQVSSEERQPDIITSYIIIKFLVETRAPLLRPYNFIIFIKSNT